MRDPRDTLTDTTDFSGFQSHMIYEIHVVFWVLHDKKLAMPQCCRSDLDPVLKQKKQNKKNLGIPYRLTVGLRTD